MKIYSVLFPIVLNLVLFKNAMADLNNGLVAYYPFNGNANDESANANHGSINGALLSADKNNENTAYKFDGNDYIEISKSIDFDTVPFTYSGWIKLKKYPTSTNVGSVIFSTYSTASSSYSGNIFYIHQSGTVSIRLHNGIIHNTFDLKGGYSVELDKWTHVAASYNGDTLSVYLNGSSIGKAKNTNFDATSSYNLSSPTIGKASWSNHDYMNGSIDDLRIYNRHLSEAEILELYKLEGGIENLSNSNGSTADGIAQCQANPASCGILALTLSDKPTQPSEVDASLLETHNNYISYFLLQISHSLPIDVSVDYFTMDVTATAGQDYIMTSGKATIPAGEISTIIGVEIIADTVKENNETFKLVINNPQGANFPEGVSEITASRTIVDDD